MLELAGMVRYAGVVSGVCVACWK